MLFGRRSNKTRRKVKCLAGTLIAALICCFPGSNLQSDKSMAKERTEVILNHYLEDPLDDNTPVAYSGFGAELLGGEQIPERFMAGEEIINQYPDTRSQMPYGSCWAFSAIGMAEFDAINKGYADQNVDYSELQLAYYTFHPVVDALGGTSGDVNLGRDNPANRLNYLDMGGTYYFAARSLAGWVGVTDEEVLPYRNAAATFSNNPGAALARDYDRLHLENAYLINLKADPDGVKRAIMEHGAVGVSYCSQSYRYHTVTSPYHPEETVDVYYNDTSQSANHAVMIVGWDDSFPAELFPGEPPENGAWLVRNSWTEETGFTDGSYFWMSMCDASLKSTAWVFDFGRQETYDRNYQYDGMIYSGKTAYCVAANVFRTPAGEKGGTESLDAVSFSVCRFANVNYTIEIYENIMNPADPCSGRLQSVTCGQTGYAGYYTIPLEQPVILEAGNTFSVVITLEDALSQGRKIGMDIETVYNLSDAYDVKMQLQAEYGQSFVKLSPENSWDAIGQDERDKRGNICIKAFTRMLSSLEPTPTPDPTLEPTPTPDPTLEPTPTPDPTLEPTPTPDPTLEPTPTPDPTLEPTPTPDPTLEPTPTPDPTLEPTPTLQEVKLVFRGNGSDSGSMEALQTAAGTRIELPKNVYNRTGYRFMHWNTKKDDTGRSFRNRVVLSPNLLQGKKTLTLYAIWKPITYSIRLHPKGAKTSVVKLSGISYGQKVTLPKNIFQKSGYRLKGFSTQKDGKGTVYKPGGKVSNLATKLGKAVTLYAVWEPIKYTVRLHPNGGKGKSVRISKIHYGKAMCIPKVNFSKEGYRLVGWCLNSRGVGKRYSVRGTVKNMTSTAGKTVTLYAVWKRK